VPLDVDKLMVEVAARFQEHGMVKHLESLRVLYRERQRERRAHARSKSSPPWNEDLVIEWAALWRIPPFENVYPVLQRGSLCPCSSGAAAPGHDAKSFIEITFPEGHLVCCGSCKTRWLVLT
jgi:hypothetical protein